MRRNFFIVVEGAVVWADDMCVEEKFHHMVGAAKNGSFLDSRLACAAPFLAPSCGARGVRVLDSRVLGDKEFTNPHLVSVTSSRPVHLDGKVVILGGGDSAAAASSSSSSSSSAAGAAIPATASSSRAYGAPKPCSPKLPTSRRELASLAVSKLGRAFVYPWPRDKCVDSTGHVMRGGDTGAPLALNRQIRVPHRSSLTNAVRLALEVMYAMSAYHRKPRVQDPSEEYSRFGIVSRYAGDNCGTVAGNVDMPVKDGEYLYTPGLTTQSTTHSLVSVRSILTQGVVVYDMFGEGCFWDKADTRERGLSPCASVSVSSSSSVVAEANGEKLHDVLCWLFSHAHAINIDAPAGMACMYHANEDAAVLSRSGPLFLPSGRRPKPVFEKEAKPFPRADSQGAVLCPHCVARELGTVPMFLKKKLAPKRNSIHKMGSKPGPKKRSKTPNTSPSPSPPLPVVFPSDTAAAARK